MAISSPRAGDARSREEMIARATFVDNRAVGRIAQPPAMTEIPRMTVKPVSTAAADRKLANGARCFWPLSARFNRLEPRHSPLRGAVAVMADIDDGEETQGVNADHVR
jgi:hypothetical protein